MERMLAVMASNPAGRMRWIGCHGMSGRLAIVPDAVDHAVGLLKSFTATSFLSRAEGLRPR